MTACYNEEENIEDVYREIKKIRDKHDEYKCLTKRLNACVLGSSSYDS